MADLMRMLGVGSRFWMLALAVAMLGGGSACSTRLAGATSEGAEPSAERSSGEPEQVVRNMVGKSAIVGKGAVSEPSARGGDALASEARASAAGVARTNGEPLAPRATTAETITSKHLEAELNRLEAELAN